MIDKLEAIKGRFEEVAELIVHPDAMSDMKKYSSLGREYKELERIVNKYKEYKDLLSNIESAKSVLSTEKDRSVS